MEGQGGLRVLVVDDNEDSAKSLATMIELWGHEAQIAFSGYGAHSLAKEFLPNVVIADVAMPKMSGLSLAGILRQDAALKDCQLIALSGHTEKRIQEEARRVGFSHYFFKPIEPERLRALLAGLVSGTVPSGAWQ